jgi:alpha-N-arabinofuranosidase
MIQNPILPGFYSDPSVCRAGEDYYLATSSFEFFPGVPLFHSKDLVNWRQIGHCLQTPEQLDLTRAGVSDGIFAPTLRHHRGRFYMITANRNTALGNHFFVTAEDPAAAWSAPTWIKYPDGGFPEGLDPSLFFDDGGRAYFQCVAWDGLGQGIGQAEIDLATGALKSRLKIVWRGTGGAFPEGPHTYRIGPWYYLMIAEGGTEYGHKVTIARALSVEGPYEACPRNPILTQAALRAQDSPLQGAGHGDLIRDHTGAWWLIVHAFRPSIGKLHHLGRETTISKVRFDESGWPVVNEDGCLREVLEEVGAARASLPDPWETLDLFDAPVLPPYWNFLRNPDFSRYQAGGGEMRLTGSPLTLNDLGSPTFLGRRQQHFACEFRARLQFAPEREGDEAGVSVFQTPEHHYDLAVVRGARGRLARLKRTVGDIRYAQAEREIPEGELTLIVLSDRENYRFVIECGGARIDLGSARTQLISTEAMQYQNFTGTYLALYAVSAPEAPSEAVARFSRCHYRPVS